MKLGVFDSGIGGKAVAESLGKTFPYAEILVVNDKAHLPYGSKNLDEVARLTDAAIQPLLEAMCDIIILACNTATAASIEILRQKYPDQLFIGLEPMVKPAAASSLTSVITVCATPTTLSSERYQSLKKRYGQTVTILEPDCSQWAYMIEKNQINEAMVVETIRTVCQKGTDTIVLACTHYHWIKDLIARTSGSSVHVIDPSDAIARRIKQLLEID